MPATSRFVLFDVDASTGTSTDSSSTAPPTGSENGRGKPGHAQSDAIPTDILTIQQGVNDQLQVEIDGQGFETITLTSGTDLDARMIAREISFKFKQLVNTEFEFAQVEYINNKYRIYSSSLGDNSSADSAAGSNDVALNLRLANPSLTGGSDTGNSGTYTGTLTASGVFTGQFDDIYTLVISDTQLVGESTPGGGNVYAGTVVTAGDWNESSAETYTVTVNGATNPTMNGGAGNVPTVTWTSSPSNDNDASGLDILYSDYFYEIGTQGLRLKFSDAPFGTSDTFTVVCSGATGGVKAVGAAAYHWSSLKEGKSSSTTTTQTVGTRVGTRGVEAAFSSGSNLTAGDEFTIICSGPQPTTLGVTTLNYGAVTVSTYSPVKAVWFELVSGATILSNTKFGLQSHGTAQHHNQGGSDTFFGFGTAGKGNSAGTNPEIQTEWRTSVTASDISSDTPPDYLSATEDNLSEVATADNSEAIGVGSGQMVSDFVWLAVKLGANETGANPSITYRMFFDFS
ncbi:MAG: hypothetical protein DRQ40_00485 [Gammaproteobacteria bacterium]|nr:MAG: hypothetical protein DRQ40_00485 [Gammaproteobacteria bacterium]